MHPQFSCAQKGRCWVPEIRETGTIWPTSPHRFQLISSPSCCCGTNKTTCRSALGFGFCRVTRNGGMGCKGRVHCEPSPCHSATRTWTHVGGHVVIMCFHHTVRLSKLHLSRRTESSAFRTLVGFHPRSSVHSTHLTFLNRKNEPLFEKLTLYFFRGDPQGTWFHPH